MVVSGVCHCGRRAVPGTRAATSWRRRARVAVQALPAGSVAKWYGSGAHIVPEPYHFRYHGSVDAHVERAVPVEARTSEALRVRSGTALARLTTGSAVTAPPARGRCSPHANGSDSVRGDDGLRRRREALPQLAGEEIGSETSYVTRPSNTRSEPGSKEIAAFPDAGAARRVRLGTVVTTRHRHRRACHTGRSGDRIHRQRLS